VPHKKSAAYVQSFYSFPRQLCYRHPMNAHQSSDKPLESVLERAREAANGEQVDLKDLVQAFGDRAFGPVFCDAAFISAGLSMDARTIAQSKNL